jgi:hypothetical protein
LHRCLTVSGADSSNAVCINVTLSLVLTHLERCCTNVTLSLVVTLSNTVTPTWSHLHNCNMHARINTFCHCGNDFNRFSEINTYLSLHLSQLRPTCSRTLTCGGNANACHKMLTPLQHLRVVQVGTTAVTGLCSRGLCCAQLLAPPRGRLSIRRRSWHIEHPGYRALIVCSSMTWCSCLQVCESACARILLRPRT